MNPISFSNRTLFELLNIGGYAILSADRNPAMGMAESQLTDAFIEERFDNLSNDLKKIYAFSHVVGRYDGAEEKSLLVVLHNDCPNDERTFFIGLGEKYNQDSIIYVKQSFPVIQQMIYTTGLLNGTYVEGEGYEILSANTTDNYSRLKLCPDETISFTLNFNFDEAIFSDPNSRRLKTKIIHDHHKQNRQWNKIHQQTN